MCEILIRYATIGTGTTQPICVQLDFLSRASEKKISLSSRVCKQVVDYRIGDAEFVLGTAGYHAGFTKAG